MGEEKGKIEAERIIESIDDDGSGEISYSDYLRVAIDEQTLLSKDNLRKTFEYFDKDGSNAIEKQELCNWLSAGDIIPENIISELMLEADTNGDGSIDISEFEELLISKLQIK
jgi:Ca2+-binding EF-hand superfamily protein